MKIGCCLNQGSFVPPMADEARTSNVLEAVANTIAFLADTGFEFVEPTVGLVMNPADNDFAALLSVARASRLRMPVFNSFIPPKMPLVGSARDLGQIQAYLAEACARMGSLGGKLVVFGSGAARRVPEGYEQETAQAELIEFLQLAADAAAPHGITIVVEPLNKLETNVIHTVAEGLALAAQVARPNVTALADTYHMEMEKEPVEALIPIASQLAHVHVADTSRRAPGTGSYDYSKLRACLDKGGYTGDISIECKWDNIKAEAAHALAVLRSDRA